MADTDTTVNQEGMNEALKEIKDMGLDTLRRYALSQRERLALQSYTLKQASIALDESDKALAAAGGNLVKVRKIVRDILTAIDNAVK